MTKWRKRPHGKVEEEDHRKAEVEVEAKAAGKTEAKEKVGNKFNRKVEIMLLEMSIDSFAGPYGIDKGVNGFNVKK